MKRITVEEVRRAYEATGLKPINCEWGDGVKCGCPLTALLVEAGLRPEFIEVHGSSLYSKEPYYEGFIDSVDEAFGNTHLSAEYEVGHADGKLVRAAIFGDSP